MLGSIGPTACPRSDNSSFNSSLVMDFISALMISFEPTFLMLRLDLGTICLKVSQFQQLEQMHKITLE